MQAESESESEYFLSQYRSTGKFVLRCTATNQNICCPSTGLQGNLSYDAHEVTDSINNRLLQTEQKRLKTYQTHTQHVIITALKKMFEKASVIKQY